MRFVKLHELPSKVLGKNKPPVGGGGAWIYSSFDLKWNSQYDGNGLAAQFWQMESALYKEAILLYY